MRKNTLLWQTLAAAFIMLVAGAQGQVPQLINYQGQLTDASGNPLSGTHTIVFGIYDKLTDGPLLWEETHTVTVTNGFYSVLLGAGTPPNPIPLNLFDSGTEMYLQLTVDGEVLTPRHQLGSVPYAFRSQATGGGGGNTLDQAYDQGGPGVGRTIIADAGEVNIAGPGGLTVNGNVGIGTARSLFYKLDIFEDRDGFVGIQINNPNTGPLSSEGIYFTNEDGSIAGIRLYDDDAAIPSNMSIFNNRPGGSLSVFSPEGSLTLSGQDISIETYTGIQPKKLTITSTGNVGIGTTTPQAKLDVRATDTEDLIRGFSQGGVNPVFQVSNNGNVGIGTPSPTAKLQIGGTPGVDGIRFPDGTLQTTAAAPGAGGGNTLDQAYDQGGPGAGRTITADAGPVNIAGPNGLTVNGNVGIGTLAPVAKLHSFAENSGAQPGVQGETASTSDQAFGVLGIVTSANAGNFSAGVRGINNGTGFGGDLGGIPVGVWGSANSGGGYGVYGESSIGIGVYGIHSNNVGFLGSSAYGVYGSNQNSGSYGFIASFGEGVYGNSSSNGVVGFNSSSRNSGTLGETAAGVFGLGISGNGVYGYRIDGGNYAGYFYGNVHITGDLSKGGGSFKIDHPLDPENKYLFHSFVESPDMMNIYNGNVILDAKGEAVVQLPTYFQTLNNEYRYQLTCIGGYAPVYIAEEITNNAFKIAGGKPRMKISWQVTGIRQDAFARAHRIQVEKEKTGKERGKYLYPREHGMPESMGMEYEKTQQIEQERKAHEERMKTDQERMKAMEQQRRLREEKN